MGAVELNHITDHEQAITPTEQDRAGNLIEAEWREALQPLNIDPTLIPLTLTSNNKSALTSTGNGKPAAGRCKTVSSRLSLIKLM